MSDLIGFLKDRADMLETLQLSHSKGHSSQPENKKQNSYTHNTAMFQPTNRKTVSLVLLDLA